MRSHVGQYSVRPSCWRLIRWIPRADGHRILAAPAHRRHPTVTTPPPSTCAAETITSERSWSGREQHEPDDERGRAGAVQRDRGDPARLVAVERGVVAHRVRRVLGRVQPRSASEAVPREVHHPRPRGEPRAGDQRRRAPAWLGDDVRPPPSPRPPRALALPRGSRWHDPPRRAIRDVDARARASRRPRSRRST